MLRTSKVIKAVAGVGRSVKIRKHRCREHDAVRRHARNLIFHPRQSRTRAISAITITGPSGVFVEVGAGAGPGKVLVLVLVSVSVSVATEVVVESFVDTEVVVYVDVETSVAVEVVPVKIVENSVFVDRVDERLVTTVVPVVV